MTEVAQIADVFDHDMDDLAASDGENKENEVMNAKEDHAEEEVPEELEEKTVDGSNQIETTQTNGMKEESDVKKDQTPKAVNGVAKDAETKQETQPETNEDWKMSEFDLKKEACKVFMVISEKNNRHTIKILQLTLSLFFFFFLF